MPVAAPFYPAPPQPPPHPRRRPPRFPGGPPPETVLASSAGRERWLALEDLVSFHVGDVEVFLRMDLAFRDRDGRVVIVDWKTGRAEGRFNEVQIAGYALYAAEQGWVDDPEQILTELNYLAIARSERRTVKAQQLEHARRLIC